MPKKPDELIIPVTGVANFVKKLATKHDVVYAKNLADDLAQIYTRLGGDDVEADEIECLIIQLMRDAIITKKTMVSLLVQYLRELGGKT